MIRWLWRRWLAYWDGMWRRRDAADGIYRTLEEAQAVDGYAAVTSSLGYIHFVVVRARDVAGGTPALETIATQLEADNWGPRPDDERFAQDDEWSVVAFTRDDPVGMAAEDWLWLHDEVEQLGWRRRFAEVLRGSSHVGDPDLASTPAALTALRENYDDVEPWLRSWWEGEPTFKRIGDKDVISWDHWFERGLELLGPPPVGRVWYASTIRRLLDAHRPGWDLEPGDPAAPTA